MVILLTMGSIVQEREQGTAVLILSKPVSRAAFLGAKFLSHALLFLFGLVIASLTGYYYMGILFEWLPAGGFAVYVSVLYLYWLLVGSVTFVAGVWARSQMSAAGVSFGILFLGSFLGLIPAVKPLMPATVIQWAETMALGLRAELPWAALGILVLADVILPLVAWVCFRRQEL
jgi:ABC-2 type transport system permease protein